MANFEQIKRENRSLKGVISRTDNKNKATLAQVAELQAAVDVAQSKVNEKSSELEQCQKQLAEKDAIHQQQISTFVATIQEQTATIRELRAAAAQIGGQTEQETMSPPVGKSRVSRNSAEDGDEHYALRTTKKTAPRKLPKKLQFNPKDVGKAVVDEGQGEENEEDNLRKGNQKKGYKDPQNYNPVTAEKQRGTQNVQSYPPADQSLYNNYNGNFNFHQRGHNNVFNNQTTITSEQRGSRPLPFDEDDDAAAEFLEFKKFQALSAQHRLCPPHHDRREDVDGRVYNHDRSNSSFGNSNLAAYGYQEQQQQYEYEQRRIAYEEELYNRFRQQRNTMMAAPSFEFAPHGRYDQDHMNVSGGGISAQGQMHAARGRSLPSAGRGKMFSAPSRSEL